MNAEPAHPEGATVLHRLLVGLVGFVHRYPRSVVAVSLGLAAVSGLLFYTRLEFRTQRSDLVNPHKASPARWRRHLAASGDDDDMVVVVRGGDRQRMKDALDALAGRVRQQPERFDRLFYRVDLRGLHNRALLFLPPEQIEEIRNNVAR